MYKLKAVDVILQRLREPWERIQVVAGPHQVGKTTSVEQARWKRPSPCRPPICSRPSQVLCRQPMALRHEVMVMPCRAANTRVR